MNTEVLGISANVRYSQKAFADFLKLNYPLLSDSRGEKAIKPYGVYNKQRQRARRSYFIVDKEGIIRFKMVDTLLPNEYLLEEIKKINHESK